MDSQPLNQDKELEDINVSIITSDSETLYLEDDNNSYVSDLQGEERIVSPKTELDRTNFTVDPALYFRNNDELIDVLKAEQIRWFYKNLSNKQWVEFNGYDSLRIEHRYKNLTDKEWAYYNTTYRSRKPQDKNTNCSPTYEPLKSPQSINQTVRPSDETTPEECISPCGEINEKVVVRDGLFEVDILKRNCTSIFWPGEETVITRGTWFYENTWQPVELDISEDLEHIHLSLFIGKRNSEYIQDAKAPKKVIHTAVLSDNHIDWYAPNEVYLYSQATPSKIVRNLTSRLGGYFQKKSGYRLLRGYKDAATDKDKPKDISHLVFVVHGIGQKMDIGGRILHNTSLIRQNVTSLHEKLYPNSNQRAEFFPVEWRTNLTLDGGLVEAITPLHLTQLRNLLNTSAMDIMYYTSPIYCAEIQKGLITELNRLYTMFVERNPSLNVKVSVVAHSLGCVIVYDIITGWLPMSPPNIVYDKVPEGIVPGKSRLKFHVDNLFMLGSPLAVFLALRYPQGQHGYHLFPPTLCNRLYNVFHISDAVAYRLEPLVVKDYSRIAPLRIWPCNSPHRIPYSDMPLELIDPHEIGMTKEREGNGSMPATTNTTPKEDSSPAETPIRDRGWSIWNLVRGGANRSADGAASPQPMDSPTRADSKVTPAEAFCLRLLMKLNSFPQTAGCLEHRLDYVIKVSGSLGVSARTYINMLSSHTAYWGSEDVAFFVLTRLFPELDETVDTTAELCTESEES
ncbi:phospholipase DDHD1-like [Macrosteles quadrilineatus]|nr:phospholipase DDHD1-like [Macrosteles quadrilineatus]